MKRIVLIICGLGLAVVIILPAVVGWIWLFGSEALVRSDQPLSRDEAKISSLLPKSACNVYYLLYAGGLQDAEHYIRFETDRREVDVVVEAIIRENNATMGRQLSYKLLDINKAPHVIPRKEFLPMTWWNTNEIKDGYYRGEIDAYAVRVWVDKEKQTIYVYQND